MIRRGPRPADRFTIISNSALEDESLTWRARGVLAYLLGRPEGWTTSADRLSQMSPKGAEGRDSMRKILTELEASGYVRREKVQDRRGRWSTTLVVYDAPEPQKQADPPAKSAAERTIVEESAYSKKSSEPTGVESSKNVGSPGVGQPAVGQPDVGGPGVFNKKETKKETKKEKPPRSVAPLPPSSEDDLPRTRRPGVAFDRTQAKEAIQKLERFPGREYLDEAGGRWNIHLEDGWFLTCEYIDFVQAKGWKYSPDGWIKYVEDQMVERRNRPRPMTTPDGVPL